MSPGGVFEVPPLWWGLALGTAAIVFGIGGRATWQGGAAQRRLRLFLYAVAALAGLALATRPRLLPVSAGTVGVLATPGRDLTNELRRGLDRREFAVADVRVAPGAWDTLPAELSRELSTRRIGPWSELATSGPGAWRIVGSGLRQFELDQWPVGIALQVDASNSAPPDGLLAVRWPRTLQLGNDLNVEGRVAGGTGVLRLVGPGGPEGEVALAEGETPFSLVALPKAVGSLTYRIERLERSVLQAERAGDVLAPETLGWLDVTVTEPHLPRVTVRAARPSPEAAALRRSLARRGFDTRFEMELGGGVRTRVEGGGTASAETALAAGTAGTVDAAGTAGAGELLVVMGPWASAQRAELENQATARGAGIVATGLEAVRSFAGAEAIAQSPSESAGSTGTAEFAVERATTIRLPGGAPLSALRLGPARLARPKPPWSGRPILVDESGASLALAVDRGPDAPPLVLSVVDAVYRYELRGERAMAAKLWSALFEAALPTAPWGCTIDDGPVVAGDPMGVDCVDAQPGSGPPLLWLETPEGPLRSPLPIQFEEPTGEPGHFRAVIWPWHGIHRLRARRSSGEELELAFRASSRAEWAAWDFEQRRRETQTFVERPTPAGESSDRSARNARRPIPWAVLWAMLLAALGLLWGVERTG